MNSILSIVAGGRRSTRWVFLSALFVLACGSGSTDPGGGSGEITFSFVPASATVPLIAGETRDFEVIVTGTDEVTATWSLDGTEVATGTSYTFEGTIAGELQLTVEVSAGGEDGGRDWRLVVDPDESTLPLRIGSLTTAHGEEPSEVVLEWPKAVNPDGYPLQGYLVAASYAGPIGEDEWDDADFVLEVPVGAGITQRLVMAPETHDIRPDQTVWFTARARDDRDQLSNFGNSPQITVTSAWYLDLLVQDDRGEPMNNILVDYGCSQCDRITRSDGTLRIGPFRSIDTISVGTLSSDTDGGADPIGWFDYQSGELTAADSPYVITLLGRYDLDLAVCNVTPDNFVDYLMTMTKTGPLYPLEPERMVHRWQDYPVSYFVTDGNVSGIPESLESHARAAFPVWNTALGREMLVEAADSASADIVVRFVDLAPNLAGVTRRADGAQFGTAIPEKVFIDITRNPAYFDDPAGDWIYSRCSEVALHEIGHALGLIAHSCSYGAGNLMDNGGATSILADLDPADWHTVIRQTEVNAVQAISQLPQGVVMGAESDDGDFGYETQ